VIKLDGNTVNRAPSHKDGHISDNDSDREAESDDQYETQIM
jgi:hypothetical protein